MSVSGGAPTLVILDNLREGVLAPDIYDPALNPLYRRVLAHYGVTALSVAACRCSGTDRSVCLLDNHTGQLLREHR